MNRVLIVEDMDASRKMVLNIVSMMGYEVDEAPNGEEALKKIREGKYPVVLSDIKMPGIDGIELLKKAKEIDKSIEFILITGHATVESAVNALELGAYDYVEKPLVIHTLEKILKNVFNKIHLETEVRLKNEEIRQSEKLFRMISDSMNDIMYVENNAGDIIYLSSSFQKVTGIRKEDLNGSFSNLLTKNKVNKMYQEEMRKVLNGGDGSILVCEIKDKKNKNRMMEVNFAPLKEEGKIIGVQAVMRDVTETVRLEKKILQYSMNLENMVSKKTEELKKSEEKYREFIDNAIEGVFQCTSDGNFLLANKALTRFLGYENKDELFRVNVFKSLFANPADVDTLIKFLEVESGISGFETILKSKTGNEVVVNLSVKKVVKGELNKVYYEGFVEDLTQRKRYESKLHQMDKLSSLGRLAAGVAHEIKNPLTGIKMMSQMLLSDEKYKEHLEEMMNDIHNESLKIEKIVNEMLSFSRQTKFTLEKQSLHSIIDTTLMLVKKPFKEKNVEIKIDYDSLMPWVFVDSRQIEQVFINIFLNALDAMPDGGELCIKTIVENRSMNSQNIEYGGGARNTVVISDTGTGIAESNLPKIFDPFFTTKPTGTGLGLSIAYQILQKHNCSIDVQSKVASGTTFIIKFPVY